MVPRAANNNMGKPPLSERTIPAAMSRTVLGMRVDATSYEDAAGRVARWAQDRKSSYVCVANVHMTMETFDSSQFRRVVNAADLVTPDGKPLVWALRFLGVSNPSQVRGADLVMHTVEHAAREDLPIGLYGGTSESLQAFVKVIEARFPEVRIVCQIAPPFRPLTPEEDEALTSEIASSGAHILFVGLGCPKQEKWMAEHRGRIPAVMLGVGAAFDFLSGAIPQAPRWMQETGLEWVYRLMMDPGRLWKRYAKHNPRFVGLFLLQLLGLESLARKVI
jgi:N-acetylglucosaminyldiphosphoundecaprenol N-acetyl-beta-D-mannosaminyltransferase